MENKALKWESHKYSKWHVADYKPFMFVDGEGVRCSIYVSGCLFNCKGCFNKAIQDFNYGEPYTAELEDRILEDLSNDYVQGLTLLGGEPFLNTGLCIQLVSKVREKFGDTKDVWSWSGYTFEELLSGTPDKLELLEMVDVLVDGKFILEQRDLTIPFRGSRNQRIIDVKKSLLKGKTIEIEKYMLT